jgi:uncharacterized membrane protein YeaQ/YmgE (transglycosylase-associated protein family)
VSRSAESGATARTLVGVTIIIGFFLAMAAVLITVRDVEWRQLDGGTAGIIGSLIGSIVTSTFGLAKDYVGWLFGSSASSDRKTELMARLPRAASDHLTDSP